MPSDNSDPFGDQTRPMPVQPGGAATGTATGTVPVETGTGFGTAHPYRDDDTVVTGLPVTSESYPGGPAGQAGAPPAAPLPGQAAQPSSPVGYGTKTSAPKSGALVAAGLAFLVVVLGVPALVLTWRSALGPVVHPTGLVGGLLAVSGLSVLAAGLFPLATAGKASTGTSTETGPAAFLRPPVLLTLVGALLLLAAAIAV